MKSPDSDFGKTFNNLVEYWGKSRMDIPMKTLEGYDNSGKLLITLGILLQGVYVSIFTFGNLKDRWHLGLLIILFATLLAIIFCAAKAVCTEPIKGQASGTFELFKKRQDLSDADLTLAIHKWCNHMDALALEKHIWLLRARWILLIHIAAAAVVFSIIFVV